MKRIALAMLLLMSLAVATACVAQAMKNDAPNVYRDAAEETRFHLLTSSLRCVMCQNESLADSDAMIAHDLRHEILVLMREGKTDAQIRDFLVARYGEFVLYKPRVEPSTWLLWFGPLGLFVIGGATVFFVVRHRAKRATSQASTADASVESSEDW